ncbi:MAG TPA: TonB-dependent receptor [Vicinamibacterales bacterium]|nr:TonB-dependent receptor [Vicinamibacterales bacterium]
MRCSGRAILSISLLAFFAGPPAIRAQATTGTIYGVVVDESKSVLPGATIQVSNVENGATRTLVTDPNGHYRALNLPPGVYSVSADLPGFTSAKRDNLVVEIGRDVVADLTMKVGSVSEQVVVQGAATNVDLSSAVAGGVVSQTQIAELPLNGRSFMQLATLQPGVTVSRGTARDFTGGFGNTQLSIGGARPEMTGYLLEGTNIADISDKAPSSMAGVLLGVDAVKEFSVQTHDYSAEFGRAAGGVISAVTKSGTNRLHGTAFEFLRNSHLDSPNFFDPIDPTTGEQINPPFTRNQFGGTAGGPIVQNQLFYFGSYEGLRQDLSLTHIARLPTAAAHNGVLPTGPVVISPLVKPYLELLYPIPNGQDYGDGTGEYRYSAVDPTHEHFLVGKVDWQLTNNNSMFVRVSRDKSDALTQQDHPLFLEATNTDTRYFTVQDQHLFSSRVLNVARGAINYTGRDDDVTPTVVVPPSMYFTTDPHFGAITIQSGITQVGTTASTPINYRQTLFQVSDTVTLSSSAHTVRFGGDVQRYHFDGFSYSRYGGEFRFTNLQNFLRGTVNRFTGNMPDTDTQRRMRQSYVAFFGQDEWKPSDNFTLSYGLRYEFFTIPYDVNAQVAGLLSFADLESGPNGVTPGSDFFKNPSKLDFAPRVGVAWNPFGDQRTSIKAGSGLFYQPLTTSYYRGTSFRIYPYFAGVDIRTVPVFGPPIQILLEQGTGLAVQKRSEFIDYDARQPYTTQYHASVAHEFSGQLVAEIGYIGSRGYHLPFYSDPNARPVQFNAADGHWQVVPGSSLPFPSWGRIRTRTNAARSWYNGLTATVNRRYSRGLLFQASYTYGNSRDTWSGGLIGSSDFDNGAGSATNYFLPENELGPSSYDVRHTVVVNAVYQLPFGQSQTGAARQLLSGWQVGVIANYASGIPFTPLIGYDYAGDGSSDPNPQKPDWAPGFNPDNAILGDPNNWFDANAFVLPAKGEYGNVARNSLRGPDLKMVDLSIFKNVIVGGKNLQFRVEVFNLFNRANFATPNSAVLFNSDGTRVPTATNVVRTATSSRQVQLGLKFVF